MYMIMYSQLVILEKLTQKSWSEPKSEAHYMTTNLINEYMNTNIDLSRKYLIIHCKYGLWTYVEVHAIVFISSRLKENVPGYICNLCSQRERDAASERFRGTPSAISSSESYV